MSTADSLAKGESKGKFTAFACRILKNGRTYTKSSDFVSFLESIQKKYLKDLKFIEKGWADKKKKNFLVLNDIFNDNE